MKKKTSLRRVDVNVEELDRVIDETEKGPLSEADRQKLRTTLHALVESLQRRSRKRAKANLPGMAATERARFVAPKR